MLRTLIAAVLLATGWIRLADAFQLVPIAMDFAPAGAEATQTFGILNDDAQPVAVQISVVKREVALDGTETLTPAEEEFLVYPPQALVAPGKVQLVQVRWIGSRTQTKELPYRIIAEQLPVELDQKAVQGNVGRINILLRYEGAIYVAPPGVKSDIVLENVGRLETAEGPKLTVTLSNRGTSHGILTDAVLSVRGRGADGRSTSIDLKDEALGNLLGGNVLAGNQRQFLMDWPVALAAGEVTATLKAQYGR